MCIGFAEKKSYFVQRLLILFSSLVELVTWRIWHFVALGLTLALEIQLPPKATQGSVAQK